jgi:hypothetical protein
MPCGSSVGNLLYSTERTGYTSAILILRSIYVGFKTITFSTLLDKIQSPSSNVLKCGQKAAVEYPLKARKNFFLYYLILFYFRQTYNNYQYRLSQNSSGLYIWVINIGIFIFFKDIYYMKSILLKKINSSVSHVQKVRSKAAIFTSIESGRVCF